MDDFGQPAAGYASTVHFTASNGSAADYTFTAADAGQHTFAGLVLRRAGTYAVSGADAAAPLIDGSTTFTITPAAADHFAFSLATSVTAGVPFALTVTIQDAYGNTVTDYTGMDHFMFIGPETAMADYAFTAADAGSHTFNNLVLDVAGAYVLTGTDAADPTLGGSFVFTVLA